MYRNRLLGAVIRGLVALVVAGCAAGTLPSPVPSGTSLAAPPSATPTAGTSGPPRETPVPASTNVRAAPPQVFAAAQGGPPVPGDQGSFTWSGLVSNSPWVLGWAALEAGAADALEVTVAGDLGTRQWTAVWAGVSDGVVADAPEGEASGTGLPISVRPPRAGSWSLRVEVWSGDLGHATWYWRVEVPG